MISIEVFNRAILLARDESEQTPQIHRFCGVLEEAATDPDLNAWFDTRGQENADKCAWTFGTTYTASGALANMHLGARDFLIQRNWVNASGGFCAQSF